MLWFTLLYALSSASGIMGIGLGLWTMLRSELHDAHHNALPSLKENPCLSAGIAWLLGYFSYECILSLLLMMHMFWPVVILSFGAVLSSIGTAYLFLNRVRVQTVFIRSQVPVWELFGLSTLALFVLFWNLYPRFDVDSLSFYLPMVQQYLNEGGRFFSSFADIRLMVSSGENLLYALGLAWQPNSTLFPQIIHGISKVMFLVGVYGAARACGTGPLALSAAALVVSEEHFLCSGANRYVYINMLLTSAVFFMFFCLFVAVVNRRRDFLVLSGLCGLAAVTCKYLAMGYVAFALLSVALLHFFHEDLRKDWTFSRQRHPLALAMTGIAALAVAFPFVHNWIATGTPLFPASFGLVQARDYDGFVSELADRWHYRLSSADALKNISAFLVWPGILPSKILLPLALVAGFTGLITKHSSRSLLYGICFFLVATVLVAINTVYMVFEMRYYRFGIGIFSLACALFLAYITHTMTADHLPTRLLRGSAAAILTLLICAYSLNHSFSVMRQNRPSAHDILSFLSGKDPETVIMAARFPTPKKYFDTLKQTDIDEEHLGVFPSFNWPQAVYPVGGKHLGFLTTAAFPSATFFSEGLFAQALLKTGITHIFIEITVGKDYPQVGGAVFYVLEQCTAPLTTDSPLLVVSKACLLGLEKTIDREDAQQRMRRALDTIRELPGYTAFNPPKYGAGYPIGH